jgi:hypothetical protein
MKTWMTTAFVFTFLVGLAAVGCSNSETKTVQDLIQDTTTDSIAPTDAVEDSGTEDVVLPDIPADAPPPSDVLDTTVEDLLDDTTEVIEDSVADADPDIAPDQADVPFPPADFGFEIRIPQEHKLQCDGPMGPQEMDQFDLDWVCTFEDGDMSAHIYSQASPSGCTVLMAPQPEFATEAWISIAGVITSLGDPSYYYGHHNNDWLEFTWEETHYKLYHSSFGYGWRKCQPMDCIQILNEQGEVTEDGCTMERTLPIVCVPVEADGTYAELVDSFEPCEGDPNYL